MSMFSNKFVLVGSAVGTLIGGVCFLKDACGGTIFTNNVRAEGKVVIVTGANTGIGKETVRDLAKRGAKVYMACRDLKRCEEAREEIVLKTRNKYIYCRKCDLASQKSIREFVDKFKNEESRLDILINNAGVMRCPRTLTADGIELQFGVNHLGHFLLTNLLLDTLKSSQPSRVVTVSSIAHKHGKLTRDDLNSERSYDPGDAYNQSKLANILFANELAKRLEGTGVTSNSLHPGIVDTDIIRHMSFFTSTFSNIFLRPFVWPFVRTPSRGAQTTLYVALEPNLKKVSGVYFDDCEQKTPAPQALDEEMAKWLWAVSEKWVKSR